MASDKHGALSFQDTTDMRILVTGASGFVGKSLLGALRDRGHEVTAASRSRVEQPGIFYVRSPELGPEADWSESLADIDSVVHLAGLAHVTSEKSDPETGKKYLRLNADGSGKLAEQCAASGVKHFVFLSSCHAVAAESDEVLTDCTNPRAVSAYGRSKLAAEGAIKSVLADSDCAWTILRPPLVYGPGNKANFGSLVKLVQTGIPLPLASVRNRRSFIYVENLVDLIVTCLANPKAFGKTFFPSDGEDVSTPELIRAIARASASVEQDGRGKIGDGSATRNPSPATRHSPRLFPFPESLLKAVGRLPGLGAVRKLTSSLYVDSEPIRRDLGWSPPFTMEEGLRRTLAAPMHKAGQ
jgi:nucleoside-diphosphate-sugar epimerase